MQNFEKTASKQDAAKASSDMSDAQPAAESDSRTTEKSRVALISLLAAFGLTSLKLGTGLYTASLGILFEALHSGLDLLAAGMTLVAVRMAAKPPDAEHPYGHGKIENLSALVETSLLILSCIWVGYEGVLRLLGAENASRPSLLGVGVMAVSIVVDVNRTRVLRRIARAHKSQALEANALHFSTDILSSSIVLIGVFLVWLADTLSLPPSFSKMLAHADTVAAFLVILIILRLSLGMALKAVDMLMDSSSHDEEKAVTKAVRSVRGITAMRRLRLRSSGSLTFVDLTVGVAPNIRVSEGHRLAHEAEKAIADILPGSDVTVHVEPLSVDPARNENPFELTTRVAQDYGLAAHNVLIVRDGVGSRIELHVELPGMLPFAEAYSRVRNFENALRDRLPGTHVLTHLEPEGRFGEQSAAAAIPVFLRKQALEQAKLAVDKEALVRDLHNFSLYMLPEHGVCMSFHCTVEGAPTVEEAHSICMRLEKLIQSALPGISRIITHLEPDNKPISGAEHGMKYICL